MVNKLVSTGARIGEDGPMGPISVRDATVDDAATWRLLRHRALQDAPFAFGSTYARERDWGDEAYAGWLADGYNVLGEYDGTPVGIGGGLVEDGWCHIVSIWVAPEARRRGVNGAMITRLVEHATEAGLRVELMVTLANTGARIAYERLGFVGTGEIVPVREGESALEERMVLPER